MNAQYLHNLKLILVLKIDLNSKLNENGPEYEEISNKKLTCSRAVLLNELKKKSHNFKAFHAHATGFHGRPHTLD